MMQAQYSIPELYNIAKEGDINKLQNYLVMLYTKSGIEIAQKNKEYIELYRRVEQNPYDIEAQKQIEEMIRQRNVNKNMNDAFKNAPEILKTTTLLFVKVFINNVMITALVDTGAQTSVMTEEASEKCNIGYLIDKRMVGTAVGVGITKIIGKIHLTDVKFGSKIYKASFTIIEKNPSSPSPIEFIIGLDILKNLNCIIDLRKMVLILGDGNEVEFISNE